MVNSASSQCSVANCISFIDLNIIGNTVQFAFKELDFSSIKIKGLLFCCLELTPLSVFLTLLTLVTFPLCLGIRR